ncbi:MAG TPA: tripartite tricarboxylate transporter substrate binding protein [Xanthobacteraceae bacterium]|nr:tripartite tricarboxylate transporter substrate binding protein [Xanthobacteraceae bacterium]
MRLVINDAPGGAPDVAARLIGEWLSVRLGQPFIAENRPGGGGNIGTEAVVRSPPDGYTLLVVSTTTAINATVYENLNFNLISDVAPVSGIVRFPLVMVINPSFPAKTIAEFIACAKANPGKLNMASAGNGTGPHVAGELFKMMAGIDMVHVPYRGGPAALTAVLGGQADVYFVASSSSIQFISAGKLIPLAVTTAARWQGLPNVPALVEFVPGYEASVWFGIGAPKSTPTEVVNELNREINAGLIDPKLGARFADIGGTVMTGSPAVFGKLIADETEKWAKVVKSSGAKPD